MSDLLLFEHNDVPGVPVDDVIEVVIHKDKNSDYGVTFPDIPGCFSVGTSIEEALAMSQEAAECHIEGMLLDSEPIPVPTSIESHRDIPDY